MRRLTIIFLLAAVSAGLAATLEGEAYAVYDAGDELLGYIDENNRILDTEYEVRGYIQADCIKDDEYIILAYLEDGGDEKRIKNTSYRTEYYLEVDDDTAGELTDRSFRVLATWDSGEISDEDYDLLATYEWDDPDTDKIEGLKGHQVLYYLLYFTDLLED
jgi:hypothetical protein